LENVCNGRVLVHQVRPQHLDGWVHPRRAPREVNNQRVGELVLRDGEGLVGHASTEVRGALPVARERAAVCSCFVLARLAALDACNRRWGRGTVVPAAAGVKHEVRAAEPAPLRPGRRPARRKSVLLDQHNGEGARGHGRVGGVGRVPAQAPGVVLDFQITRSAPTVRTAQSCSP
jgi:hypothetical protein